jgi:hypothetical protein
MYLIGLRRLHAKPVAPTNPQIHLSDGSSEIWRSAKPLLEHYRVCPGAENAFPRSIEGAPEFQA